MFSLIFPGQGSQTVGMGKELYEKFDIVKKIFLEADNILDYSISSLILEGPKEHFKKAKTPRLGFCYTFSCLYEGTILCFPLMSKNWS